MVRSRSRRSVFDMPLVFEAGDDPPIVLPPGTFRCEEDLVCDETPFPFDDGHDDLIMHEDTLQDYDDQDHAIHDPFFDYDVGLDEFERTIICSAECNDNSSLYRAYDVFIYKDADPRAKTQFYVLHDFKVNSEDQIERVPSRFAVVSILMVFSLNLVAI